MKLISLLSAAALLGFGVSALGFCLSTAGLGGYALAAAALVAIGAVRDYSPRRSYWEPGRATTARFPAVRKTERLAA